MEELRNKEVNHLQEKLQLKEKELSQAQHRINEMRLHNNELKDALKDAKEDRLTKSAAKRQSNLKSASPAKSLSKSP